MKRIHQWIVPDYNYKVFNIYELHEDKLCEGMKGIAKWFSAYAAMKGYKFKIEPLNNKKDNKIYKKINKINVPLKIGKIALFFLSFIEYILYINKIIPIRKGNNKKGRLLSTVSSLYETIIKIIENPNESEIINPIMNNTIPNIFFSFFFPSSFNFFL